MDKKKKIRFIIAGTIEVAILLFCLIVAIIVATTFDSQNVSANLEHGKFIGTLQTTPIALFFVVVFPVLLIFLLDGGYLIYYAVKRESALNEKEKSAIEEEAKRQAREEVLRELQAEQKDPAVKTEEKKSDNPGDKK